MPKKPKKSSSSNQGKPIRLGAGFDRGKTVRLEASSDHLCQQWLFHDVCLDGSFGLLSHGVSVIGDILKKVAEYSKLTWSEIKRDQGKHHYLNNDGLSGEALEEIRKLVPCDTERVFSMRLTGEFRVIGLRDSEHFIVKWIDPHHGFCPSHKKHA